MSDEVDPTGRVKCPSCSELVLAGARICKHCREYLDPALKAERVGEVLKSETPEQAAFGRKVGRSLTLSIVATVVIGWALGILLGPLLIWRSRRLGKEADRLKLIRPGGIGGVMVCGVLCLVIGLFIGMSVAAPFVILAVRSAAVTVDNGLTQKVAFSSDGVNQGTVAPGEYRAFSVRNGERKLVVRGEDGTVLYEGRPKLSGGGKYILNPSAANSYLIRTNEYTTGPTIRYGWSPPEPVPLKGEPFMDVSEYDYVLESMPSTVAMAAGQYSTQRRGVQRAERSTESPVVVEPPPPPPPPRITPEPPPPPPKVAPEPAAAIERRVRLDVTADSWREGGPYKIEKELKDKLAAAGVGVVPKNSERCDGTLKVTYSESRGKEYKPIGSNTKIGDGTEIDLTVEVLDPAGDAFLKVEIAAQTPDFVQGNDFFGAAVARLHEHGLYKVLGECVGASMGLQGLLPKLLPALTREDSAEVAKKLLKEYEPRTPQEAAWMALGNDDYDACAKLGAAALEPLLAVFERDASRPEGLNEAALAALVRIGGPKVRQTVLSQLEYKKDSVEVYSENVLHLIRALTTLEEGGAVPVLEQLAKGDHEEVSAAAKKALRTLRSTAAPAGKAPPPVAEKSGDAQADRFNDRGLERLAAGKWGAATAGFTQAIDLAPRHGPYYWNRARSRWNARAWRAALADLEQASELLPAREDDARLRIFILRSRMGDGDKAALELKAYAADRGGWVSAAASVLLGDSSPEALLDQARDPAKTAQANFYAGMSCLLKGNSRAAAPYLRKCADAAAAAPAEAETARVELEGLDR